MKLIITESQLEKILSQEIETINEDMVRLRTLTTKSIWNITKKYENMTVGDILDIHPSTIYWAYCKVQWANFTPDILNILAKKFPFFFRPIDKPGTDPEQFENFVERKGGKNYMNKSLPELKQMVRVKRMNGEKPDLELMAVIKNKEMERKNISLQAVKSKSFLQRKNQGK